MTRDAPPTLLAKPVAEVPGGGLATLRRKARDCRACPLWKPATQTVFGDGPAGAEIMLIGEQPGLHEDMQGEPFVGPAGLVLDRALQEAGIERGTIYLTNTVKHFKYAQRGTAKLHKRANAAEQAACRMWLAAELARVQAMATWHPSAILRGRERKDAMYRQLVADLRSIKGALTT